MEQLANLLSNGAVIGFYQGRSELGPRALGNRSIIGDPRKKEMWPRINLLKGREWWRPLAPSLIDHKRYLINAAPNEFMTEAFLLKEEVRMNLPSVCHVDGTTRPQTVSEQTNKNWYHLIKAFEEITGESIIINTSFNIAGEPLVETPGDAIRSFSISGLDAIWVQGWLLTK